MYRASSAWHLGRKQLGLLLPLLCFAVFFTTPRPAKADALAVSTQFEADLVSPSADDLREFYAARNNRPLWTTPEGRLGPAGKALLDLVATAEYDGIEPSALGVPELAAAVRLAEQEGSGPAVSRAELMLSRSFAAYVRAMKQAPHGQMVYEPATLKPVAPTTLAALTEASRAASLFEYVRGMGWMHPLYGTLRASLTAGEAMDTNARQVVLANLGRIRAIGGNPSERHAVVDAANARLFMYENNRVVDSMRVIVGKPAHPTPMMSALIRYAIVNPYWNIPTDYVRDKVAGHVLRQGPAYLKIRHYEVLSDWGSSPAVVDPATIDWHAAASGALEVRIRQLPTVGNAMGRVKYELPNNLGIYLHDTPEKALMVKDARQLSLGCIRLEDAQRLGHWLFGGALPARVGVPEQKIDLPHPVPIYITYVTAQLSGGRIAIGRDPYSQDGSAGAALALHSDPKKPLER